MTCVLPSIITIDDGTTVYQIPGHASEGGMIAEGDTGTGYGETEYADGSARLWIRFRRRQWTLTFQARDRNKIKDLDWTVATWAVTMPDPDGAFGETISVTVVPAKPVNTLQRQADRQSWTLTLREAQAAP